jgi:CRISPR-associated protein Csm5
VSNESFRVFLVRTAVLMEQKGKREYTLGWKHANGSSLEARRVLDSTPRLAEMAMPGTVFEGDWIERAFYQSKEVAQQMHWRETIGFRQLAKAANDLAAVQLAAHKRFAEAAQLPYLLATLGELEQRLAAARERNACLVSIGRGGGYLTKTAFPDTADAAVRQALGEVTPYGRALRTGMPFPKTRRIVFLENHPVALPGWVWLEVS